MHSEGVSLYTDNLHVLYFVLSRVVRVMLASRDYMQV